MHNFEIARIFKIPVVAFFSLKSAYRPGAPYDLLTWQIWDGRADCTASALLHRYVETLEKVVRSYPVQWFNFFDFWQAREGVL